MTTSLGVWGVPDFGSVLERARIAQRISRRGTSPIILHGVAGCGKSVAAAHYARQTGKPVVWIDACGEFLNADQVASAVSRALSKHSPASTVSEMSDLPLQDPADRVLMAAEAHSSSLGISIIIDDQGSAPSVDAARALGRLARLVRTGASQLTLTTRSVTSWPADVLCDWELIGAGELALDKGEAFELLQRLGYSQVAERAEALRESCNGHPALFAVLASQAASFGVDATVARTTSLDAWLERLIATQMSGECRRALFLASLVKSGDEANLESMGVARPGPIMASIAAILPLAGCARTELTGIWRFRIHDLVIGFLADKHEELGVSLPSGAPSTAVRILSERGEFLRAANLVLRHADTIHVVDWLESFGRAALSDGLYAQLEALLEAVPTHKLVTSPRALQLWAELCSELGNLEDALAKSRAARSLADHEGNEKLSSRAASLMLRCLCRSHRLGEAQALSEEILSNTHLISQPDLHAEALVCLARARLVSGGSPKGARRILDEALRVSEVVPAGSHTRYSAVFLSALVEILDEGDWMSAAQRLSALVVAPREFISSRVMARGNLGVMLAEVGRLRRAQSMLEKAIQEAELYGLDVYAAAYLPVLGHVTAARGEIEEGIMMMQRGIDWSESLGEGEEAQLDRLYLASVLRAALRTEASLAEAERAFEHLSAVDNMGYRRLAAFEVAASLLALGDVSAARTWTESASNEGPPANAYHRLRADMILAEADRQEGHLMAAVKRLAPHKDYVRSENANWQIAMYSRAFPELLGLWALAVGPETLPAHMVRMIMPEQAEVAMMRTKGFVDDKVWRALGKKLFGNAEFARFIARDGLPLCHVRMFGGLEVNIGTRSVRERDWKKRKARLLFTMLMMRQGQDVAREQIFEHLWPDMDEPRAKSNLYVVWSAMKSVLLGDDAERGSKCPYVESVGGVCRSVRQNVRTDVDAFESACARGREAESKGDTKEALQAYRQISELYRGDLLPGDCYDDWFINLREHYRTEFIHAMLRATEILLEAHDPHTALIFVRRALQFDQFREDLYQAALRCQIAAGQRSSAIDTYLQCRDKICEELGLDPSAEMRALYDEILAMEERPEPVHFDPLAD